MRKIKISNNTALDINESWLGEPLEITLARVTQTGEPIEAMSPIIYTDREEGIIPAFDIRADRWEAAREAMDKASATAIAKRDGTPKIEAQTSPSEPIQATE